MRASEEFSNASIPILQVKLCGALMLQRLLGGYKTCPHSFAAAVTGTPFYIPVEATCPARVAPFSRNAINPSNFERKNFIG